jgi:hypothetical protein
MSIWGFKSEGHSTPGLYIYVMAMWVCHEIIPRIVAYVSCDLNTWYSVSMQVLFQLHQPWIQLGSCSSICRCEEQESRR